MQQVFKAFIVQFLFVTSFKLRGTMTAFIGGSRRRSWSHHDDVCVGWLCCDHRLQSRERGLVTNSRVAVDVGSPLPLLLSLLHSGGKEQAMRREKTREMPPRKEEAQKGCCWRQKFRTVVHRMKNPQWFKLMMEPMVIVGEQITDKKEYKSDDQRVN